ncbi:hypothetical protein T484DRAFT_1945551 [Baffinella frigidus]|nr:hypothetical protein T484DRAFT_1945551 [Cryptophyta sp. CCMP2293]|mmetsp:Transcript_17495/g.40767  ORF Transcript_17495/g.40767 Transcript_17495/m.40767 type:complete len:165 (+) Transcript_17495:78-572(+)
MRTALAFALAACVLPSVDAFASVPSPALRNAGARSVAGNLCMTLADDQQLSRRALLSSAAAAAVSLTAQPAWAQPPPGTKPKPKPKSGTAAVKAVVVPPSERAASCNTFPMSVTPTCTDPEISNKGILKNLDKYKSWRPDPADLSPKAGKSAAPAAPATPEPGE